MVTTFCSSCGGLDFCLSTCAITRSAKARYFQRTLYCARVMLATSTTDEQRHRYAALVERAQTALTAVQP